MTESLLDAVAWIATALSLIGLLGVSHKRAWGQLVWIVSNVLWVAYYLHANLYPSLALFAVYLGVSIHAYRRWRMEERR